MDQQSNSKDIPVLGSDFRTLRSLYRAAEAIMAGPVWDFLDLGAGDNETIQDNRSAFSRWKFRPRVMTGIRDPRLRTTFLGLDLSMPVMTAPFGADRLYHQEGYLDVARASAENGIASVVPEACSFSLEQIAEVAPSAAKIFQFQPNGPRERLLDLMTRAEAAGYEILCVTVDCPVIGWRDHLLESGFRPPLASIGGNQHGGSSDDAWALASASRNEHPGCTWDTLGELCSHSRLPFVCKGILTAEDAIAARNAGAVGIVVSNHGGRQLDGVPAAIDQLPEIRKAVGTGFPVALDGGIRRGADVLKALALGADVVLLGRAAAMGLAVGGRGGVGQVFRLLRDELVTTMILAGCEDVRTVNPTTVQPAGLRPEA